jgi:hypothetical protein
MNINRLIIVVVGLFLLSCFDRASADNSANADWPMFGQNTAKYRF